MKTGTLTIRGGSTFASVFKLSFIFTNLLQSKMASLEGTNGSMACSYEPAIDHAPPFDGEEARIAEAFSLKSLEKQWKFVEMHH